MKVKLLSLSVSACMLSVTGFSQEFLGADEVLKRVSAAVGAKDKPDEKADPATELQRMVSSFKKKSATLPPAEAATQWLALLDAYATIPQEELYRSNAFGDRLSVSLLLQALPPSSAWPALTKMMDERAAKDSSAVQDALRLLSAVLRSDSAAQKAAEKAFRERVEKDTKMQDYEKQNYLPQLDQLAVELARTFGTPEERVALFEQELASRLANDEKARQQYYGTMEVPDLVKLVGAEKATPLLKKVMRLDADAGFSGKATQALAAKIALEDMAEMKRAHWSLIQTSADLALYEAMKKKFPAGGMWGRGEADVVYVLSLISAGRSAEAGAAIKEILSQGNNNGFSLMGGLLTDLQRRGQGKAVLALLKEMLASDPTLPLWSDFITLSAQEGAAAEALELMEAKLKDPKLPGGARGKIEPLHANALLAADKVEEGITVLRALIKASPAKGGEAGDDKVNELQARWKRLGMDISPQKLLEYERRARGQADAGGRMDLSSGLRLSRLGTLLNRPELVDEGMAAAKEAMAQRLPQDLDTYLITPFVKLLVELKRGPEAEAALLDAVVKAVENIKKQNGGNAQPNLASMLTALAWVYQQAGRPADVLKLLDESPYWAAQDLSDLLSSDFEGVPLTLTVAQALAALGREEQARPLALRLLQRYPAKDEVYTLLLTLKIDKLEVLLDETFSADRFEERPLIWKGRLQLDAGRTEEAEKTLRAAIAIDPSDGEQGKGTRMRAYAYLAEALEKKGNVEQAKIMRGAVAAIRLSESADDWWQAGLLTRAVKMYEEALKLFADAYCVQSRLALRYSELGDLAKAEMHYQRAYELMPESFGRMESHCFGCERIFSGKQAQGIAERVFIKLTEKMPDRPQLFYLLGHLREAQGLYKEAAAEFRKAVKLDPDYLNAWKQLASLADQAELPKKERDEIALAILRVDASGEHSSSDFSGVSHLGRLWDAILAAEVAQPPRLTGPLYPLAASKAEMEKRMPGGMNQGMMLRQQFLNQQSELRNSFGQHRLLQITGSLLETGLRKQ